MAQTTVTAAPKFYSIESLAYPGYFLTQQGTQVVLNAKNRENPFQLWYRDDSWTFLVQEVTCVPAAVLINHGSKKALKSQLSTGREVQKVTVGVYDPAVEDDTLLWSYATDAAQDKVAITSSGNANAVLGHSSSKAAIKDGVPAVTTYSALGAGNTVHWKIVPYEPTATYQINTNWVTQYLTSKEKFVDVKFQDVATVKNDELNVVGVSQNNIKLEGTIWYKVPAGGKDNTTFSSSFIVINKSTGFALKGSTKPGDKVILTQYDPLDYNFVWSENRLQSAAVSTSVVINLDGTNLQWCLPLDFEYQNSGYYHPLTLVPATANNAYLDRQAWRFTVPK